MNVYFCSIWISWHRHVWDFHKYPDIVICDTFIKRYPSRNTIPTKNQNLFIYLAAPLPPPWLSTVSESARAQAQKHSVGQVRREPCLCRMLSSAKEIAASVPRAFASWPHITGALSGIDMAILFGEAKCCLNVWQSSPLRVILLSWSLDLNRIYVPLSCQSLLQQHLTIESHSLFQVPHSQRRHVLDTLGLLCLDVIVSDVAL